MSKIKNHYKMHQNSLKNLRKNSIFKLKNIFWW
jgi:hypothetical protein